MVSLPPPPHSGSAQPLISNSDFSRGAYFVFVFSFCESNFHVFFCLDDLTWHRLPSLFFFFIYLIWRFGTAADEFLNISQSSLYNGQNSFRDLLFYLVCFCCYSDGPIALHSMLANEKTKQNERENTQVGLALTLKNNLR